MTTEVDVVKFHAPNGEKYLTIRSVVYDSWIMWQDALPFEREYWRFLTEDIYNNIVELGTRVHKMHQSFPGYKALSESPFEFILWWDPTDQDPDWNQGKKCRFMINDFTAEEIAYYSSIKKGNKLTIRPMTTRMVEAMITPAL